MKTKKLFAFLLLFSGLFFTYDLSASAPSAPQPATEQARAGKLISRLEEIRDMDMSRLSKTEKKKLRKEVKGIERELHSVGGGIYISGAALLIIIILLIILL